MESERVPTGGLFSPNTTPALAQKFISGRFGTGASISAPCAHYTETFVFATQFVFAAKDARTPSQNRKLQQSLAPFLDAVARNYIGPKEGEYVDQCAQITRVTIRKSDTMFWAPVALHVRRRTTVRDRHVEHLSGEVGLGANVYVPELETFASAVVCGHLAEPKVLFQADAQPRSVAHHSKTRGGVQALLTHTFEQATRREKTCWMVPKRSPLDLHFQRIIEEMAATTEERKKRYEERVGGETEGAIYMYERSAEKMRKSMLEHEVAGIYIADVASGVHTFTLEARPVVFPVSGRDLAPGEIAAANPLVEANLIVPPNSDAEILERWTTRYSLDVQLEFEVTIYT